MSSPARLAAVLAPALLAAALLGAGTAGAQTEPAQTSSGSAGSATDAGFDFGGSQPIEISADNGIEWNRDSKTYVAHGNAVASQGNTEIHADMLVAYYSAGTSQIDRVLAEGSVKIMNPTQTAYGDRADYDHARRLLVMTGSALKIVDPNQTVTARDAFEYWQDQDALVAKGDVKVVKTDGTAIDGDRVTSYFHKNADTGKREPFQVKAEGHVRIDTGKETVTCDRAVYDPATEIAVLTGNVVMTQNQNVFKGARAEIDMKKGISRLMPAPGARVISTIHPKQGNKPSTNPAPSAAPSSSSNAGAVALDTVAPQPAANP
ncbi:MAG TPA: LptA/OstA family protein [Candidatus Cybelea sp.]|nr:LptA/OstA family protein [Candidatus Cybelea sp.]